MTLLDRYIAWRFLVNFALLFTLLFVFAASIDVILNLDEFVEAARDEVGEEAGLLRFLTRLFALTANFQGPRLFQFFSFLHGLIAIGAMGFTLSQMYRQRELIAMMASGISLHRVGLPLIGGMFVLSILQLANQEITLPRMAPLVLRGHGELGRQGVEEFDISLTRDGSGMLLQSPHFSPQDGIMERPTFIVRDDRGLTTERITAESAVWSAERGAWLLTNGQVMRYAATGGASESTRREPLGAVETDLDPNTLLLRRHGEYASMLSMRQLGDLIDSPDVVDVDALVRHRFARFAAVLLNIQVLLITLPSFLLREPGSLLMQSLKCSAVGLPVMLMALVMMTVSLPGISPAVSVFLPVIILLPVVMARVMYVKT